MAQRGDATDFDFGLAHLPVGALLIDESRLDTELRDRRALIHFDHFGGHSKVRERFFDLMNFGANFVRADFLLCA